MLKHLYIKNFTLIDELDIDLYSGFSVITGETGAGKSIILGAIGLLLGNRADTKSIKSGKERCIVEAIFDISNYDMMSFFSENDIDYDSSDCIIRREVNSNGKSRAFINDTPVALSTMREIGEMLIDVHSQHQNLLLNKEDFQLNVVDIIANDNVQLKEYKNTFAKYCEEKRILSDLKEEIENNLKNEEFLRFQYNELSDANLIDGEQEELEQDTEIMSHAEEIKSTLFNADTLLTNDDENIVQQIKTTANNIHEIENVYPTIKEIAERLDSCYIEIKDIAQEISNRIEDIDFDPQKLEQQNSRLDKIYTLEHKYHVESIAEILKIQTDLKEKIDHIDNSNDELQNQQKKVDNLKQDSEQKAKILTKLRTAAAKVVENEMLKRLVPLGIQNVRFQVNLNEKPLSADGMDKIAFLFSANKSTPMQPVSQVASGGEIARVMLSLKAMISGAVKLPTIVFDEIDTGVSGKVAEKMAQIMKEMGDNKRQVISITHLPQIAAIGTHHYRVSKEDTETETISKMAELSANERVNEIAQMLSGDNISNAAIQNARALLNV